MCFILQEPGFESKNEESKTEIVMAFLKHQWKKLLISGIVIFLISIVICIGVILSGKSELKRSYVVAIPVVVVLG